MTEILLKDSAEYYKGLEHQNKAWDYLQSLLTDKEISNFTNLYRNTSFQNKVILDNFPMISQRDNRGDWNRDGRDESLQTCNVTSVSMVVEFLTGRKITPKEIDAIVRSKFGSRYVHSNLVKVMSLLGVKSQFDVSTTHTEIKEHLRKGLPVIWSNKITHGGHIVVVTGFDEDLLYYQIHDPFGEPYPINKSRTKWNYLDSRKPYALSYRSFNIVNANGFFYHKKEHWCHLCSKK